MKKDFKQTHKIQPGRSATIKRIQVARALRRGISTMGTPYQKGSDIIHLSSSRATGETWVFTVSEWKQVLQWPVGSWNSPKKWDIQIAKEWEKKWGKLYREQFNVHA